MSTKRWNLRELQDGYRTSRQDRIKALQRRLDWLDAKIDQIVLYPKSNAGGAMQHLRHEREATYWAIDVLSALVECHNLKWAIEREKRQQAERQQDDAVRQDHHR